MATSLELAITAIRSGRKEEGRQLLNLLIQQNPNNEMAWLWMSSVVNTDEQRARCLYHVLAINPDNELARRGLQLLGIVVSDSRPVKVPRDSQPIPVQRPEPEATTPWPVPPAVATSSLTETQPLAPAVEQKIDPLPAAAASNQTVPMGERRPFRLDPRAITQELPFVPLREPFSEPARRSPSAFAARTDADSAPVNPGPAHASEPVAAILPADSGTSVEPAPALNSESGLALIPITKVAAPASDALEPNPANPTPAAPLPDAGSPLNATPVQMPTSSAPTGQAQYSPLATPPEQPPSPMSLNETRPSQPIWVTHSNVTMGMPQPMPQNQGPYPNPGVNSNVTMGMPTQYLPPQNPMQNGPAIHSNATMGMPLPGQNGQMPYPVEAMPVVQPNGTFGMAYGPAQFQPIYPQNQVFHSNSTMAMPTMSEAEARARLMAGQPMPGTFDPYAALRVGANQPAPASRSSKKSSKKATKEEDDEEEEVNLLAVIVFGSLSVTALGGMGMLILLWFTSF